MSVISAAAIRCRRRVYGGHRATTQFQAIPFSTESSPNNPGGVIDLNRFFGGTDLHLTDRARAAGRAVAVDRRWSSYDNLEEHRQGFTNFIGKELGVEGALRRHENNRVYDIDEYLQAQWDPFDRWRAIAGLRNSVVEISDHNLLPVSGNPDSGVRYAATNPVAGIVFRAAPQLHLYGSYGRGFETPTLNDLAYRSTDGSIPGLNLGLKPARSDNYELGLKAGNQRLHADLAAFYVQTQDELAVQANAAGRSVYENIGRTQRTRRRSRPGRDAGRGIQLARGLHLHQCGDHPAVHDLRRRPLPGSSHSVRQSPAGSSRGLSSTRRSIGPTRREDSLPHSRWSVGHRYSPMIATARLPQPTRSPISALDSNSRRSHWHMTEFARVDNIGNRAIVGSVIVNETNSRFFEPDPGRTFDLMFTLAHRD